MMAPAVFRGARQVYRLSRLAGAVNGSSRGRRMTTSLSVVRVAMADAVSRAGAGRSGCGWGWCGSNGSGGVDSGIGSAG